MADEFAIGEAKQGRNVTDLLRYILGVCVGVVVLLLLFGKRGELTSAWHEVSRANLGWALAAITAEAVSLYTYAFLQRRTLRLAVGGGPTIPMPALAALSLANDAIANTVPGEPVISSAYRYRYYRRHGVPAAAAGWTIFTVLVAQAIGLSLLLLLGVIVALAGRANAKYAPITIVGLVLIAAAVAVLVRRDLVLRLLAFLPRAARKAARRASGDKRQGVHAVTVRIESTLARMREIPLSAGSTVEVTAIAAMVWFADSCCLLCSFGAVRSAVPWSGVLLAYGVAQVAGSLPIVPGGIGIIEGSLAVILMQYGARRVPALSAALVYRTISFWLVIAIGWITVGIIARRRHRKET